LQTCTAGRIGSDIAIAPGIMASLFPKVPLMNTSDVSARLD
jgi:hypothetical protein